jgi:hypothetical protein
MADGSVSAPYNANCARAEPSSPVQALTPEDNKLVLWLLMMAQGLPVVETLGPNLEGTVKHEDGNSLPRIVTVRKRGTPKRKIDDANTGMRTIREPVSQQEQRCVFAVKVLRFSTVSLLDST